MKNSSGMITNSLYMLITVVVSDTDGKFAEIEGDGGFRWQAQHSELLRKILRELDLTSLIQTWTLGSDGYCHVSIHPLVRDWIRLRLDDEKSALCALL